MYVICQLLQAFQVLFNGVVKYDDLYSSLISLLAAGSRFDTARRQENKPITPVVSYTHSAVFTISLVFALVDFALNVVVNLWYRKHVPCSTTSWCCGKSWECCHPQRPMLSSLRAATVTPVRATSCTP